MYIRGKREGFTREKNGGYGTRKGQMARMTRWYFERVVVTYIAGCHGRGGGEEEEGTEGICVWWCYFFLKLYSPRVLYHEKPLHTEQKISLLL